ncbi:MAG TPA: FecR family protein [Gemmatimonadaceae bacterium]|nr:FecR family protein [Gemmatimonadaceae bacterium]
MSPIPNDSRPPSKAGNTPAADTHEHLQDDTRPTHWPIADLQELADFLNPEQSAPAHAATIHRLQTDAAFAHFATPILRFCTIPLPGADVDVDAAWAAVERKAAAWHQISTAVPVPPITQPSSETHSVIAHARATRMPSRLTRSARWPNLSANPLWAIALLLFIMTGYTTLSLVDRAHVPALHYYAATGVTQTIRLADGSHVTLAPGATLVTDGVTTGTQTSTPRTVHLDGTGTFDVHADPTHPFIVETHDISTVALGTVFNVTVQPNGSRKSNTSIPSPSKAPPPTGDVHVSVISGKVVVQRHTTRGHHETLAVLGPGQETSVQTFARYFKAGWDAAGAHKTVAEAYLENQAMQVADSIRAARK